MWWGCGEADGGWVQGGSGKKWSDPDVLCKDNNKYLDELEVDIGERERSVRIPEFSAQQPERWRCHSQSQVLKSEEEHLKGKTRN